MIPLYLRPGHDRRIRGGHPWVFSNEIARLEGSPSAGDAVEIRAHGGEFLGTAYYNPHSLIAARIVSRLRQEIDSADFFRTRIAAAADFRRSLYDEADAMRLVFGESDALPGLVVDRYGPVLSVQFLTQGMERRRDAIVQALLELFEPTAIVARNDVAVRQMEGLPLAVERLHGEIPDELIVSEHGVKMRVDVAGGQKTGHFLDQKENHLALNGRVAGRRVLDLFCYSGSWALHAARFGAAEVLGVDISPGAIRLAQENAQLNNLEGICTFRCADVFDLLREMGHGGERFGAVVLDPPAFVKSRKKLPEAIRGYLTVNRRAMELLEPGGYIFTCSCSYHMERQVFLDTLRQAGRQAKRELRLLEMRGQSFDHPVLLSCPETDYLKCAVLQAM